MEHSPLIDSNLTQQNGDAATSTRTVYRYCLRRIFFAATNRFLPISQKYTYI